MIEPYRVNADSTDLVGLIAERGLAVVDGLDGPEDLLRLAQSIAVVVPHRDSGPDGVTTIADLGESVVRSGSRASARVRSTRTPIAQAFRTRPPC
ncbi:hypothetical protein ACVDFE_04430 [Lentzea chajnantorensis]